MKPARCLIALLAWLLAAPALAAPAADLWDRWSVFNPAAGRRVSHDVWSAFLGRYVVAVAGINRVAYARVRPADRQALESYLSDLSATPVDALTRDQQRAYWINLYNALTVRTVLAHYPVATIRDIDISPGLFADGPWGRKLITIAGEDLSLDDIEHRILRPIWADPRLHYVLNYAAIGCPDLQTEAFTAANTDRLLDQAAAAFVNHPRGVAIVAGRLRVSRLFDWYRADFGADETAVIAHLRHFTREPLATALRPFRRIDAYAYDWALNQVP